MPEAYAAAIALPGQQLVLRSQPENLLTLALNQNFEVKARPAPEDTLGTQARKFRLLSIQTSPFSYDFQQAGEPGGSGWVTQQVTNSVLSDLLPGFNLGFGFDLWRGVAGADTSQFAPFLQQPEHELRHLERHVPLALRRSSSAALAGRRRARRRAC